MVTTLAQLDLEIEQRGEGRRRGERLHAERRVVTTLAQLDLEIEQRGERRGGEAPHEHLWGKGRGRAVVSACMRSGVEGSGAEARRRGEHTSRFASSTARYLWGEGGVRRRAVVSTCMRSGRAVGSSTRPGVHLLLKEGHLDPHDGLL